MKKIILFYLLALPFLVFTQIPDGSIAPDFTLDDINGNTHHLYDYLNQGKTVFIDMGNTHCSGCWDYHISNSFKTLQAKHGPNGTLSQDVIVMFIEMDENTGMNELLGLGGNTYGNWVEGTTYPILNPIGQDVQKLFADFQIWYVPQIWGICPDKKLKNLTGLYSNQLYNYVGTCTTSDIEIESPNTIKVYQNENYLGITIPNYTQTCLFSIIDLTGKKVLMGDLQEETNSIDISQLSNGIYILEVQSATSMQKIKFIKE